MVALRALAGPPARPAVEVMVPSFTFAATAAAIAWAGYEPVFVDVDPDGWHLAPDALEAALASRKGAVAAVLACSTFGAPPPAATSAAWTRLADAAGVPLLVDSAAGFGSRDEELRPLGCQGHAELFSFHATKPFAVGEGGLLTTRDRGLAQRMSALANFGLDADRQVNGVPGLNAKMDEWHAATALAALDGFEDVLARRRRRLALEPLGFSFQAGAERAAGQFLPALATTPEMRERTLAEARAREVELRTYFDPPLHRMPGFAHHAVAGGLEVTDALAE